MLVVILEVVDFLEVLIVLLGNILDVGKEIFILQIHPPEQLIVVFFLYKHWLLVLLSSLGKSKQRVLLCRWLRCL